MALIEFINAALHLDLGFIIEAGLNNIFWIFGFMAAGYFFSDKKSFFLYGFAYMGIILITFDIFSIVHFSIYTATGLGFLYLARMVVLTFLETSKTGKHLVPLGYVMVFFFALLVAAFGWI
ncbi:MAG: hypothetical protein AABW99_01365 [archaeon]